MARELGFHDYIATRLNVQEGLYTGDLLGMPVHGEQKAKVIREYAERNGLSLAAATFYADHVSDAPALALAGEAVVINPDPRLLKIAQSHNWRVLYRQDHVQQQLNLLRS